MTEDTIFAPSSAIGGAIAVIRISGPDAASTNKLLSKDITAVPQKLVHVSIKARGELLDDGMAVYLAAPGTYTGEAMVELNCHGGMQTVRAILSALSDLGFRPAGAGEFTKRAFLNGKLDLSQAEAVMDIINADAEQSRKSALMQLSGSVSRRVHEIQEQLLDALSGIDAAIDYPDEAEKSACAMLPAYLRRAEALAGRLIDNGRAGRVLRDGIRVVLAGRPNVGKSSLLNALCGSDRAIVTPIAGTTRDTVDEKISIDGVPVRLIDTAGIRDTGDAVEQIGVARARNELEAADICLVVLDNGVELTEDDRRLLRDTAGLPRLFVCNKSDIDGTPKLLDAIPVSAKTGEGLDRLKREILTAVLPQSVDCSCVTNERHLHALEQARRAICAAESADGLDCAATDIADALHYLGEITGDDVDEDVIDRIFARFCVGK